MSADSTSGRGSRSVLVLVVVCGLLAVGAYAGVAFADDHTQEEAPHYGPEAAGNATFEFLDREDHHPGAEDVDVRFSLKGGDVFADVGATDGIAADWFIVETDAVDFSDCSTDNVAAFGIDRGDNESGGAVDHDLLKYTRNSMYFDDGVAVQFYDYEDFGGDPPHVERDDQVVLELSDEAAGGGCADTTEEPGWYSADLFLNGTGPREQNRTDERYGFTVESDHTYVCECDDETEAREQLGPGPATPTATPEETATPTETATETPEPSPTPTETPRSVTVTESVGNGSVSGDVSVGADGASGNVSVRAAGGNEDLSAPAPASPTPGDGPGFGITVAFASLLASVELLRRRTA